MTPILFELHGDMPGGKTSGVKEGYRKDGSKYRYPNARFVAWRHEASYQLLPQKMKYKYDGKQPFPLQGRLLLSCTYRPADKRIRDVPGMEDALFHLLEYMKIIENDGQIRDVEWYEKTGEPGITLVLA